MIRRFRPVVLAATLCLGFLNGALGEVPNTETSVPLALELSRETAALRMFAAHRSPRLTQPKRLAGSGPLVAPAPPLQLRSEPRLNLTERRSRAPAEEPADGEASVAGRVEGLQVLRLVDAEQVTLDGRLDESFWSRAESLQRFYQVDPEASDNPPVKTEARFAWHAKTLYVAITAHDPDPSALVSPLSRRDDLAFNQDRITVYIDSIGDRRSARFFEINPAGVVVDGVFDELTASDDTGPDFRFQAKTSRNAEGWSIELAIPLASLPIAADATKPWTVLVARFYPRQEYFYLASGPLPTNCTLCVASELRGLERLPHVVEVEGQVYTEFRSRRDQEGGLSQGSRSRLQLGAEASFKPRSDTVVRMAIRPQAARFGIDEPLLDADLAERRDLIDKRPFFSEAADIIQSPLKLLNTRSVVMPQAALGVTHRGATWDGAAWMVRDGGARSLLQPAQTNLSGADSDASGDVFLLRGRYLTAAARWGALLSHKKTKVTGAQNTVLGLDGSMRLNDENLVQMQWAHSRSTTPAPAGGANGQDTAKRVSWSYEGDSLTTELAWQKVGGGFRAEVGDVESTDAERFNADLEVTGLLPWHDAGPILRLERSHSLSSSQLNESQALGIYAQLPKETRIEWFPWITSREGDNAANTGRLLRTQQLKLSSVPAPWVSELSMDVTWGDALYREGPIFGSGLRWSSLLGLQPRDDLQVRWTSELQSIRAGGAYMSRETLNQWVVLWLQDANSYVRGVAQRRSVLAPEVPGSKDIETAYTLSYQKGTQAGYTVDAGVTLRRKLATTDAGQIRSQQAEWFSSIKWPLQ